ncbi:MAG: hypothetical protein H6741_30080 [Alphaproteobacteria bacterium]|nr:hypothetical protein [Alphaproteobacteria bacterium]
MSRWLQGDLTGLMLPADLERLRDTLARALDQGEPVDALFEALAAEAPTALMDLTLGPRAPAHPEAARAALRVAEALEGLSSPAALYRRLASLAPTLTAEILAVAVARHASARWLVRFGEGAQAAPGALQLRACRPHPAYVALCFAHAEAGHHAALRLEAAAGNAPPCAALLAMGQEPLAIEAAIEALRARPDAPVVAWLASAGGPGLDEALCALAQAALPAEARARLSRSLIPFPAASRSLRSGADRRDSG